MALDKHISSFEDFITRIEETKTGLELKELLDLLDDSIYLKTVHLEHSDFVELSRIVNAKKDSY